MDNFDEFGFVPDTMTTDFQLLPDLDVGDESASEAVDFLNQYEESNNEEVAKRNNSSENKSSRKKMAVDDKKENGSNNVTSSAVGSPNSADTFVDALQGCTKLFSYSNPYSLLNLTPTQNRGGA